MHISGKQIPLPVPGNYFTKHLQFAESLISSYRGGEPFHLYIKKYFSSNKKHGSKDRKQITSLCYAYFRLGAGVTFEVTPEEKFLLGIFLCDPNSSPLLSQLKPGWSENINLGLNEKLKIVEDTFDVKNIFPFQRFLSDRVDYDKFAISFLQQPKLFLRIRPGKEETVLEKIRSANFYFERLNINCLVFSHNEKITSIISIDEEAVIQDYNSQRIGEFFSKYFFERQLDDGSNMSHENTVWDCCAGSGGKSILAVDTLKNIRLTATDKRAAILRSLEKRFALAGIKDYETFVFDIASRDKLPFNSTFQCIIADVPCSGSGTWSRTPEQLTFFAESDIEKYAGLQKNIIKNIVPYLQIGGILFYITCSVFKKENEENVEYILQNFQLNLLHEEYLKGYEMQADTLFIAVFSKS